MWNLYDAFAKVWEPKKWEQFGLEPTFFRSAYRNEAVRGPLRARYFSKTLNNLEFSRVVSTDLMWTLLAMAFVFSYITFHTGSFFLAFVGIVQILFSLPVSFFFYYYFFQISFYSQLHILTIFLVLGVGADNIFVLVDSWKLYQHDPEFNQDTFTSMLPCYYAAQGGAAAGATAGAAPAATAEPAAAAATTADGSAPSPTDPTAYYDAFWRYVQYYGEDAARKYYGAWSPPVGTPNPYAGQQVQQQPQDPSAAAKETGVRKMSNLPAWMNKS